MIDWNVQTIFVAGSLLVNWSGGISTIIVRPGPGVSVTLKARSVLALQMSANNTYDVSVVAKTPQTIEVEVREGA